MLGCGDGGVRGWWGAGMVGCGDGGMRGWWAAGMVGTNQPYMLGVLMATQSASLLPVYPVSFLAT